MYGVGGKRQGGCAGFQCLTDIGYPWAVVLEVHSGQFAKPSLGHQPGEGAGGGVVGQAVGVDVGDAVSLRIPPADVRLVGEIDAQAVGDAEAGTLTDQDGADIRL